MSNCLDINYINSRILWWKQIIIILLFFPKLKKKTNFITVGANTEVCIITDNIYKIPPLDWITNSPQLTTTTGAGIFIISYCGHISSHHMSGPDFMTVFTIAREVESHRRKSIHMAISINQLKTMALSVGNQPKNITNCDHAAMGHGSWS